MAKPAAVAAAIKDTPNLTILLFFSKIFTIYKIKIRKKNYNDMTRNHQIKSNSNSKEIKWIVIVEI